MHIMPIRAVLTVLLLSLALSVPEAAAEASVRGVTIEEVNSVVLAGVTGGPTNVAFARLTLPPGASIVVPPMMGEASYTIVRGSMLGMLTSVPDSTPVPSGVATRIPEGSVNGTPVVAESEVEVGENACLTVGPRMQVLLRNPGNAPAVAMVVLATEQVITPDKGEAAWQSLGDPVALAEGSVRIDISRVTIEKGVTATPGQVEGAQLIDVVAGPLIIVLNPGNARISRVDGGQESLRAGFEDPFASPDPYLETDEEEGGPGMVSLPPGTPLPGTMVQLRAGDVAVLTQGSGRTLRASDEGTSEVIVLDLNVGDSRVANPAG